MSARSLPRLAGAGALLATLLARGAAQEEAQESVAELFRSRCSTCHVPPDTRFEVERAWLSQVAHTA